MKDGLGDDYKTNNNLNLDDNEAHQDAIGSPFSVNSMTTESIISSNSGDLVSTR